MRIAGQQLLVAGLTVWGFIMGHTKKERNTERKSLQSILIDPSGESPGVAGVSFFDIPSGTLERRLETGSAPGLTWMSHELSFLGPYTNKL